MALSALGGGTQSNMTSTTGGTSNATTGGATGGGTTGGGTTDGGGGPLAGIFGGP
jgi:hypothetical protein